MFCTSTSLRSSCEQHRLAVSELARREAEKPRTLKEMSQGGRSQPLEWAMVHTLAWKHDIAEGGKTPFYHSVRFAPSLPVKHAICPRHRSSCWLIECDRAIHTLLPIRHHLLQKKITTIAQWQAVRQRAATSTGPWLRVCPSGGGGKGQGLQWETRRRHPDMHSPHPHSHFSSVIQKLRRPSQHPSPRTSKHPTKALIKTSNAAFMYENF